MAMLFPFSLAAQKKSADSTKQTVGLRPESALKKQAKRTVKTNPKVKPAFSSNNYFYGSMKLPVEDLGNAIVNESTENSDNSEYENKNGLIFDIGYGMSITRYFTVEAGLEALIENPFNAFIDLPEQQGYGAIDVKNRSFALQLKPVFNYDLEDAFSIRGGTSFNYRQLNSSGKYSVMQERNDTEAVVSAAHHAHRSRFYLNMEPFIGMDFKVTEKFALGFDFTYVRIDWNRSLSGLRFSNAGDLVVPDHKTSTVFFSLRAVFR